MDEDIDIEGIAKVPGRKIVKGLAGHAFGAAAETTLEVGEAGLTGIGADQNANYFAERFGWSVPALGTNSTLISALSQYYEGDSAILDTAENLSDIAIGMTGVGQVYLAGKWAYGAMEQDVKGKPQEKPNPAKDLEKFRAFVDKPDMVDAKDVRDAILATRVPPQDRPTLKQYGPEAFGAEYELDGILGGLIGPDIEETASRTQYLADKFNPKVDRETGVTLPPEYDRAWLLLDKLDPQDLQAMIMERKQEIEETKAEARAEIAARQQGQPVQPQGPSLKYDGAVDDDGWGPPGPTPSKGRIPAGQIEPGDY